jgi:beta propeller repeat protein
MADVSTSPPTIMPVTTNLAYDKEPDVDGDIIVYDSNRYNAGDIFYYRISTGQTVAATSGPEYERNAAVSGEYIAYENYGGEDAEIWIYSIPYATAEQATTDPTEQYLHDLSGHRLVYTDNRNGNLDIYMFEFDWGLPALQVSPSEYSFGDVVVGTSETMVFTLTNVGDAALTLQDFVMIYLGAEETPSIQSGPTLPMDLSPDVSIDVEVVFAPTSFICYGAFLGIYSNDPANPYVAVHLDGTGVEYEPSPEEQVEEVLDYIDTSIDAGTLEGSGPGNSANNRLQALINMIEAAGDLITAGSYEEACAQLWSAYLKCDGDTPPPDFVSGEAVAEVALMILDLRADLGCSSP